MTVSMPIVPGGQAVQALAASTSQRLAFSSTSAQSAAVGASTEVVRLVATTDCFVAFGTSPTAASDGTSMFLPAGVPEYLRVQGGQKVAAIQSTSAGSLYLTEMV